MKRAANLTMKVLYRVAWRFIPLEKRYAILWERTRRKGRQSDPSAGAYARTDMPVSG
jgi:hypothetical protein